MRSLSLRALLSPRLLYPSRLIQSHCVSTAKSAGFAKSAIASSDSDYNHYSSWFYDNHSKQDAAFPTPEALLQLVKQGHYATADSIRIQLLDAGIRIPRDKAYEKAALADWLGWARNSDRGIEQFNAWFSLVPTASELFATNVNYPTSSNISYQPFPATRIALFRSGSPTSNLRIIARYALICSDKGYARYVFQDVAHVLVRSARPSAGVSLLMRMGRLAAEYEEAHHLEGAEMFKRQFRASVVEVCCTAGWLSEAVAFLRLHGEAGHGKGGVFPNATYEVVLEALRKMKRLPEANVVEHLWRRDMGSQADRSIQTRTHRSDEGAKLHSDIRNEYNSTLLPPPDSRTSSFRVSFARYRVASGLRHLKHILRARKNPNASEIVRFMDDYTSISTGPVSAPNTTFTSPEHSNIILNAIITPPLIPPHSLSTIRKRALDNKIGIAYQWLVAEMRYHEEKNQFGKVLEVFGNNFKRGGIPEVFGHTMTRILRLRNGAMERTWLRQKALERGKELTIEQESQSHDCKNPKQLMNKPTNKTRKIRIYPTEAHLPLTAIVQLAPSLPWPRATVLALYTAFLESGTYQRGSTGTWSAFIWAWGAVGDVGMAENVVLQDMKTAGRRDPDRRQWDILAGVYARWGMVENVWWVMGMVESGRLREGNRVLGSNPPVAATGGDEEDAVPHRRVFVQPMTPRYSTYGRAIEGFLDAGLLEPAREAEKRMSQHLGYRRGINEKLDEILDRLKALEQKLENKGLVKQDLKVSTDSL